MTKDLHAGTPVPREPMMALCEGHDYVLDRKAGTYRFLFPEALVGYAYGKVVHDRTGRVDILMPGAIYVKYVRRREWAKRRRAVNDWLNNLRRFFGL